MAPQATTVWLGPVSRAQVQDLRWPGSESTFITCTGDGTPTCGQLAGQKPLNLVVPMGDVYLAAFSAGGQIVKRWLPNDRVKGVYLADATYTTDWGPDHLPSVEGLERTMVEWAIKAAKNPELRAVYTASSAPNKTYPSGAATLAAIARAAERSNVGWTLREGDVQIGPLKFSGARAWSAGGALLLDLGSSFKHEEHATKVAPLLWPVAFAALPKDSAPTKAPQKSNRALVASLVFGGAAAIAVAAGALWPSEVEKTGT